MNKRCEYYFITFLILKKLASSKSKGLLPKRFEWLLSISRFVEGPQMTQFTSPDKNAPLQAPHCENIPN